MTLRRLRHLWLLLVVAAALMFGVSLATGGEQAKVRVETQAKGPAGAIVDARERMAVFRRPRAAADRLSQGLRETLGVPRATVLRRVGPPQLRGDRFYATVDANALCHRWVNDATRDGGAAYSSDCGTVRQKLSADGWGQSDTVIAGLVPDGVGCVRIKFPGREAFYRPVRNNAYAAPAGKQPASSVKFVRRATCPEK